ncbi:MAG: hypothetical protein HYY17_07335 [Planctomycetes bacterium]|nr:hypothetical protein [Planctomycetota bacterium]
MVPWLFHAGQERGLAMKSADGVSVSMSPYFRERPDVTDEMWARWIADSRHVRP